MRKIVQIIFCIAIISYTLLTHAQSEVSVDPLTGNGNVTIPIYTVSNGSISVPVSLVYSGSGVKPRDVEGTAGMGWNLAAGGQITRVVRGLPDDVTKDDNGNTRLGWMSTSNTAAGAIAAFTPATGACSNETTAISYMNTNFPYTQDTEPDLFYVNAPGLSCELIYDRASSKFRPVGYQDIIITYTLSTTGSMLGHISSFTITNNKGTAYNFGAVPGTGFPEASTPMDTVYERTIGTSPAYFSTKFNQYQNGFLYTDAWYLSSIVDPNDNAVIFTYTKYPNRGSQDPIILYANASSTPLTQYYVSKAVTPAMLTSIYTGDIDNYDDPTLRLSLNWTTLNVPGETGQTVMSNLTGMGRNFFFSYSPVTYTPTGYTRNFLRGFVDQGSSCATNTPINYKFTYDGETFSGGVYSTVLPDSSATTEDYWGYYSANGNTSLMPQVMVNPSSTMTSYQRYAVYQPTAYTGIYTYRVGGNSRTVDPVNIMAGSLNQITYAAGGTSTITYEPNDYLDIPSNTVVKGGGIRVRTIVDSNGPGSNNDITRTYSYVNPITDGSSGRPTTLPSFAFTIPYSGSGSGQTLWNACTTLSAFDLSEADHTILYGYASVIQTGAGTTQYQYYIPGTNWDASAVPDCSGCTTTPTPEWTPTIDYSARNNCSSTYGQIQSAVGAYPFCPSTNYDFERGLIKSVVNLNDVDAEVSETDYTYTRSYNPTPIYAFKEEDNPSGSLLVKAYTKYTDFYNTSELVASVTKTLYNSPSPATAQTSVINYAYASAYHKLLSEQYATNSDGSTVSTYYNYVKDYPVSGPNANPNINALYYLQQKNENLPVETYQQVTRSGTTVTTSAALTLFNTYNLGETDYLPSKQYKWYSGDGASYSKFSITSGLSMDPAYYPSANFDAYDLAAFPLTIDDGNKDTVATFVDHNSFKPAAIFKNVAANEVAYNDFDSQIYSPCVTFAITGSGSYTPVGSHAGDAAGLAVGQGVISGTLKTNPNTQNYIFSAWINPNSLSSTITVQINGTATTYTQTVTGSWQYCEFKIPASKFPAYPGTYTIGFTVSSNPVSVDDILIYPEVADVQTATYDPTTLFKLDQTNTNGVSSYYTFDQWGRNLFTYDQFKNILQKNVYMSYYLTNQYANYSFNITYQNGGGYSQPYTTVPIPFLYTSNLDLCATEGMTVTWHFGDGSSETDPYNSPPTHTYATANTYTVTATLNSPYFATPKSASTSITVSTKPPSPPVNINLSYVSNTFSNGDISSVSFTNGSSHYTFTGSQLNTASVPPGTWTVSVTISDGQQYNPVTGAGYASLSLNGNCTSACSNYNAFNHNIYTFPSMNLSTCTSLQFLVSQFACH